MSAIHAASAQSTLEVAGLLTSTIEVERRKMVSESARASILIERERCAGIVEEHCNVLDALGFALLLRMLQQIRSGDEPTPLLECVVHFDEPQPHVRTVSDERARCLRCVSLNDVEAVGHEGFRVALIRIRDAIERP